ncbi:MAG: hypothetical protein ACOCG6_01750 [Candidatus Cloacimonadaceae bacterium]
MHMMEMVLALFATVLFTSLSLTYNQAIWAQTDYLNNATTVVQASQICHSMLDEVDAKLFAGLIDLDVESFPNESILLDLSHISAQYNVERNAVYCDQYGNPTEFVYNEELEKDVQVPSFYIKMTVTVTGPSYLRHPYSMTRIYTKALGN